MTSYVSNFIGNYFCGCGNPEDAWIALRNFLEIFEERASQTRDDVTWMLNLDRYKEFEKSNGIGVAHLLLYLMSGAGVIEHGGSVFGSWLTPLGQELREEVLTTETFEQFEGADR